MNPSAPQSKNAPWQSPLPLADVAQSSLDKALKLQHALARALPAVKESSIHSAVQNFALTDYARSFGHAISERALRALVTRTLDRDAGAHNWSRLELYLSENPARKSPSLPVISLAVESEFRQLHEAIRNLQNPTAPSLLEKAYLWLRAFELYEEKLAGGKAPKKTKRNLLKFLERNAPFLAGAESAARADALRVNFARKYAKWTASGRDANSLADARAENSGRWRKPSLPETDRNKIIAHAVLNCGGRVAQAWRELVDRRELSEEISGYYLSNPARKSHVPRGITETVKYEVAMLEDIHHGPRRAKLNGAHLFRDWSKVASLDWFQADDVTFPIYMSVPDGNGWFTLMRGQVLLMIDLRSTRILGFVLLSSRNYNANAIRSLITQVCDEYGLPRKGFYFENGSWRARILKGDASAEPMSWTESEMGLREFGLEFVHARLPRAKPVEGIIGASQNLMEGLPGYVGRNEQVEKFERVQKLKRDVENRKLHPAGVFMDEEQWADALAGLCRGFNATVQNGKMTAGLSPDEAFQRFQRADDPPVKFSPACRYLLAHHRRPVRVTGNGITLRFGKQVFNYRNTETGKLIGQTVFAWFNPDMPEILTVTDTRRQNPFCLARTQEVPAMDATPEQLGRELARIAEHQAYAAARYRILKPLNPIQFRPMIADRDTTELGEQIGRQTAALQTEEREQTRRQTKGRALSNRLKLTVPADKLRRPETVPALQRLAELIEDEPRENA